MNINNDAVPVRLKANWGIIGHHTTVNQLTRALELGRLSHAYLFVGPHHLGKETLAKKLAASVNCQDANSPCEKCQQCQRIMNGLHSDFQILTVKETAGHRAIGIQDILDFQRRAYLQPFEGKYHVLIIDDAELLTEEASNALLKLLEEPPPKVLIILLATNTSVLLPTVVSRCHLLEFQLVPISEITRFLTRECGVPISKATLIASLSQGCVGWAIQAITDDNLVVLKKRHLSGIASLSLSNLQKKFKFAADLADLMRTSRTEVREELELWSVWWRELLLIQLGVPEITLNLTQVEELEWPTNMFSTVELIHILKDIKQTQRYLEANVNPLLALEELMLNIPIPHSQ